MQIKKKRLCEIHGIKYQTQNILSRVIHRSKPVLKIGIFCQFENWHNTNINKTIGLLFGTKLAIANDLTRIVRKITSAFQLKSLILRLALSARQYADCGPQKIHW